jgi:hypothetical protein
VCAAELEQAHRLETADEMVTEDRQCLLECRHGIFKSAESVIGIPSMPMDSASPRKSPTCRHNSNRRNDRSIASWYLPALMQLCARSCSTYCRNESSPSSTAILTARWQAALPLA